MASNKFVLKFPFKRELLSHDDGRPYLIRWHLLHSRWGRIYLHKFLSSDEGCAHDHPWSFRSLMLWGGYMEMQYKNGSVVGCKIYHAPAVLHRPADWSHKVIVRKPCWTLVITSTWKRKWGFWTPSGWVKHNDYVRSKSCE